MKYTMDSKELRDAIQKVKPPKIRTTLPVLSSAKLTFADGKASVTASDLELASTIELPVKHHKTDKSLSVLLPMKTTDIFLQGKNGNVVIEQNPVGNILLKRDGLGECTLTPTSADSGDFPPIPQPEGLQWTTLDAKYLSQMFPILITACAQEMSRPILTGILCHDGAMASADGFRLVAVKHDKLNFGLGDNQVVIPSNTAKQFLKLFSNKETVDIAFDTAKARVFFKSDNISLVSQLIQDTYPNYETLIPQEYGCKVSFSSPLMMQRLNMLDPNVIYAGITRFVFQRKENTNEHECLISASSEDIASYSLTCPCKLDSENEGKIAFNSKYVQDAIKPFSLVNLELTSLSSPGKFTGDIEGLTIVVMPMFVQWD